MTKQTPTTINLARFLHGHNIRYDLDVVKEIVTLKGQWISDFESVSIDADAMIETTSDPNVFIICDSCGRRRLELSLGEIDGTVDLPETLQTYSFYGRDRFQHAGVHPSERMDESVELADAVTAIKYAHKLFDSWPDETIIDIKEHGCREEMTAARKGEEEGNDELFL